MLGGFYIQVKNKHIYPFKTQNHFISHRRKDVKLTESSCVSMRTKDRENIISAFNMLLILQNYRKEDFLRNIFCVYIVKWEREWKGFNSILLCFEYFILFILVCYSKFSFFILLSFSISRKCLALYCSCLVFI